MNKTIRAIGAGALVLVWVLLAAFAWFGPSEESSDAERRDLAQLPELTVDAVLDGSYMAGFADYAVDQFPMRDNFRTVKALFHYNALQQQDNNGYFVYDGYIVKQTYPLSQPSVNHATSALQKVYDTYLKDTQCKTYLAVVPDKGYYLAEELGYPSMDHKALDAQLAEKLPWAVPVDIRGTLTLSDYYRTDTHWRQERLVDTAKVLCDALGADAPETGDFTRQKLEQPFYGVYYGHAALPLEGESMYLLQSDLLEACRVYDPVTGKALAMYDESKLQSDDMYEVYLSGNQPLVAIENPNASTDRELVIFRDSFGSAIAPLLLQGYRSVTLVDIRYMTQSAIGEYVTFADQDVLFLYSTLILNESSTMKR